MKIAAAVATLVLLLSVAQGRNFYPSNIPNGAGPNRIPNPSSGNAPCFGVGHTSCGGGGSLGPFGTALRDNPNFGVALTWPGTPDATLCEGDYDGDGKTNGDELGDPCCDWSKGDTPRFITDISHPGDATSTTTRASCSDAPTLLTLILDDVSPAAVQLSWTEPADTASCSCSYALRRAVGAGAYTTIDVISVGTTSYLDENVIPNTTYNYRLNPVNLATAADGDDSPALNVVVPPLSNYDAPAIGPYLVESAVTTETSVSLVVDDYTNPTVTDLEFFIIESAPTGTGTWTTACEIARVAPGPVSCEVPFAWADQQRDVRYHVNTTDGTPSDPSPLTTWRSDSDSDVADNLPTSPSSIAVSLITDGGATITINGYDLDTSRGDSDISHCDISVDSGSGFNVVAEFRYPAQLFDTSPSLAVEGLEPNVMYNVTVECCHREGCGVAQTSDTFTTLVRQPVQPAAPTLVAASSSAITLSWTTPSLLESGGAAVDTYEVEQGSATEREGWDDAFAGSGLTTTFFDLSGLTEYTYRLRYNNTDGQWSSWSPVVTFATAPSPPDPDTGLGDLPPLTGAIDPDEYSGKAELADDFTLYWKVDDVSNVVEFAMDGLTDGWLGIGFDPSDGRMADADLLVAYQLDTGELIVNDFWSVATVRPTTDFAQDGGNSVLDAAGSFVGGNMKVQFRRLVAGQDDDLDSDLNLDGDSTLIWARGTFGAGGAVAGDLSYHGVDRGAIPINLADGLAGSGPSGLSALQLHGLFMFLSWGVLIPAGVIIARFYKSWGHKWFLIHRGMNSFAWILALVGIIIQYNSLDVHFSGPHAWMGSLVMLAGIFQMVSGFLADKMFDPKRAKAPVWPDLVHKYVGRGSLWISLVVIAFGLYLAGYNGLLTVYGAWALVMVLATAPLTTIEEDHSNAPAKYNSVSPAKAETGAGVIPAAKPKSEKSETSSVGSSGSGGKKKKKGKKGKKRRGSKGSKGSKASNGSKGSKGSKGSTS